MVPDLVDQDVADDVADAFLMRCPIVEDRAAVEPDHVRELAGRPYRLGLGKPLPPEQAQQVEFALALHVVQRFLVGKVGDLDNDALAQSANTGREGRESGIGHRLEILERGGAKHCPVGRRPAQGFVIRKVETVTRGDSYPFGRNVCDRNPSRESFMKNRILFGLTLLAFVGAAAVVPASAQMMAKPMMHKHMMHKKMMMKHHHMHRHMMHKKMMMKHM